MNYPYENLENFTLNNLLNRSIELYNSQAVLSKLEEEPMTYKSLGENVSTMVALLQSHGITKGDKVALLSENSPNWAVAYFSVTYFGAVIVPILPDFHTSFQYPIRVRNHHSALAVPALECLSR